MVDSQGLNGANRSGLGEREGGNRPPRGRREETPRRTESSSTCDSYMLSSIHWTYQQVAASRRQQQHKQHKQTPLHQSLQHQRSSAMSAPTPPVQLRDHCSVIYNNTLYTYQVDAFQSLVLQDGAQWSQLPMGIATNGSTCVQGSLNGQDSLYIVGGVTNSSTKAYSGLQRFAFGQQKWEECAPTVNVTNNRQYHGSAYLNSSSSILIYAGSQDGNFEPTSQTFLISTSSPFNVRAFSSDAPPVTNPLMMPWNSSHALMLGGDSQNKKLFTFGPEDGWQQLSVSLSEGLKDSSKVQAIIESGTDGSKVLEIFDTSVSPNQISTLLLQNANTQGGAEHQSQASNTPTSSSASGQPPTKRRRRDTALADRPAYNSTLAPQNVRNGFSLAQDPTGLVVTSGGDPGNPVAIFNQTANQWIDTTTFFGGLTPNSHIQSPTETPGSTPTSSLTSTAASSTGQSSPSSTSSSSASSGSTPTSRHDLTILGATLGAVFGTAALLILALLIIRCIRRRKSNIGRRTRDFDVDSKHEMDFADQGAEFMKEAGGSLASRHRRDDSANSNTSIAIMSGGARSHSQHSKRGFLHKPGDSGGSSKSFFSRTRSPLAPSPPPISHPVVTTYPEAHGNPLASPEPRTEPRTTETGWSKYFNNSSTNLGTVPPGAVRHDSGSRRTTYTSQSLSDYESSRVTSSHPHESAEVQPLNIRASQPYPPNTRVVSPTSGLPLPGLAISSEGPGHEPSSPSSAVSDIDEEDDYRQNSSQGQEHEGTASWTPVEGGSTWEERPISSIYADSVIYPHPGERVRIPNFPRVPSGGNSLRNSQVEGGKWIPNSATRDFGSTGVPDRELPEPGNRRALPATGTSEVRTFARRPEDIGPRGRGGSQTEDMSWLNLGK